METLALVVGLVALGLAILIQVLRVCLRCFGRKPEAKVKLPYEPFHDDVTTASH